LQAKLLEFMASGAQLGWLIDPIERRAYVYRPGSEPVVLLEPPILAGDPVLPGFVLALSEVW
jgi:Uma2 family endonuclease